MTQFEPLRSRRLPFSVYFSLYRTIIHRFNDILPYSPPIDPIAVLPLSVCPVYHAIVIPSHVLNIITIMSTLKIISLYINAISPHRATTSNKKAVSPEAVFLFSFYYRFRAGQQGDGKKSGSKR